MAEPRALWAEAFIKAQSDLPLIPKTKSATITTKTGGSYAYQFADLPDVLAAAVPVLNKHGLGVGQSVAGDAREVTVTTRIYHTSGHCEEFGPLVLPSGGDARSAGSAITYAKRYGLCSALGVAPEDDDDGARHRPRPDPQPDLDDLARLSTNKLKAEALAIAEAPEKAAVLFAEAVKAVGLNPDEPVPLDRAQEVRTELTARSSK